MAGLSPEPTAGSAGKDDSSELITSVLILNLKNSKVSNFLRKANTTSEFGYPHYLGNHTLNSSAWN